MLGYIAKKEGNSMNTIKKDMMNADGTLETLILSSTDTNYPLDVNKTYKLANYHQPKIDNNFIAKFKRSIFGADIGINSAGFANVAIIAVLVAIFMFNLMYLFWRI